MNVPNRARRDWSLIIFIIPLGILLIIIVGQIAIRILPSWSVNANMRSNLDPNAQPGDPALILQPLLPQIMTPMGWFEDYLNQGSDFTFPPFFVFEPTASLSPTPVSTTSTTPSPTATTPSPTVVVSATTKPPNGSGSQTPTATTPSPVSGCTNPTALNYNPSATVDNGSCTYPPVSGCTNPAALNYNPLATVDNGSCTYSPVSGCTNPAALNYNPLATVDDGSCTYSPVSGCTNPAALNYNPLATVDDGSCTYSPVSGCTNPAALNYNPLATVDDGSCNYPPTGYPNTIDPSYGTPAPVPNEIGNGNPNGNLGYIYDGTYIVINANVQVGATPDGNYDLVYYEQNYLNSGYVYLDWIIIGLSNFADGSQYYEVFNWGNGTADSNSNVGDVAGTEDDGQQIEIATSELYDPDGGSSNNQTGILIDVDNAVSEPPPGTYNYIVIISPPGGSGDPAEVDSVDVTEVPIPPP